MVVSRDVNFVFFPKIDYRFEKIDFFFDYRIWASLSRYAVVYYVTCRAPRGVGGGRPLVPVSLISTPYYLLVNLSATN